MIEHRKILGFLLVALLATSVSTSPFSVYAAPTNSIEIGGFRWNKFPLEVLVDMNEWSTPEYAFAVQEAINSWIGSIWAYSSSFNNTSLGIIRYTFYVSSINATNSYDILITFSSNELSSNVVGLTTYKWNPITHDPRKPITINITTYSGTANHLFIKNVAMHEFGHALGLGHASSRDTLNGPELMYFSTPNDPMVYPSTLDLYALTMLYKGSYSQSVQLPNFISYEMVQPTTNSPSVTIPYPIQSEIDYIIRRIFKDVSENIQHVWENDRIYIIFLAILLLVYILASNLGKENTE